MSTSNLRVDVVGLALGGLVAIALTVCAVAGVPAPDFLATLGVFALGLGGGAALPSRFTGASTAAASPSTPPSLAAAAAASGVAPMTSEQAAAEVSRVQAAWSEPSPYAAGGNYRTAEPATGVFGRIVTGDH